MLSYYIGHADLLGCAELQGRAELPGGTNIIALSS